ncbi:hypothetical protein BDZ89DRAFT_1139856 [Hymenopellis radicata]|nr:hypothetical protein BDZ89DRAFT_1139856 [Hymenopellis radicata]
MVDLRDLCEVHIRSSATRQVATVSFSARLMYRSSHPTFGEAFPERAASLTGVPSDLVNAPLFTIDNSLTEEKLRMKFTSVEETVIDIAKWLIASGVEEVWAAVGKRY